GVEAVAADGHVDLAGKLAHHTGRGAHGHGERDLVHAVGQRRIPRVDRDVHGLHVVTARAEECGRACEVARLVTELVGRDEEDPQQIRLWLRYDVQRRETP